MRGSSFSLFTTTPFPLLDSFFGKDENKTNEKKDKFSCRVCVCMYVRVRLCLESYYPLRKPMSERKCRAALVVGRGERASRRESPPVTLADGRGLGPFYGLTLARGGF